jgi:transposase
MDAQQQRKAAALREHGSLHPNPSRVRDPQFQNSEFFDPNDLVLVKYEMLRRVRVEGLSATVAAKVFGFSRVAFYQAMASLKREGMPGLVPRQRGPKEAHKLTDAVLKFIDECRLTDGSLRAPVLAKLIKKKLGLSVHPRSIERALKRRPKKGRQIERS